ncbi:hypothetical protein ACOSQ2_028319 [Xanthoceras sorbifolium]
MLIPVSLLVFVLFSLTVLVLLLVFHFVFRNRLNNQSAGAHDMESGLQEAGTNHYQGTESKQKPQKHSFSEVSWTAFREKCQHPMKKKKKRMYTVNVLFAWRSSKMESFVNFVKNATTFTTKRALIDGLLRMHVVLFVVALFIVQDQERHTGALCLIHNSGDDGV